MLVAVSGPPAAPTAIFRRRVELVDPGIRGAAQPYHAAAELGPAEADAFIQRCSAATNEMADRAVREAIAEFHCRGYRALGCCILLASGRPLPAQSAILASHPLIHTAEGVFFRQALLSAAERCGLPSIGVKEKELWTHAAAALRMPAEKLPQRASDLGKPLGSPWRQDEKLSCMAAWMVLAGRSSTASAGR